MHKFLISLVSLAHLTNPVTSCSTILTGRKTTTDGSVLVSHSNDGDGASVQNLRKVEAAVYNVTDPSSNKRYLTNGAFYIPQVESTYGYLSEGYAAMNEYQVSLGESTCFGVFAPVSPSNGTASKTGKNTESRKAMLNIIDLGQLCLERTKSARECISVMGELAEKYGYYDNAESLLVGDTREGWIFHILPTCDSSSQRPEICSSSSKFQNNSNAIWMAQKVQDDEVAAVMNSFTIREFDTGAKDSNNFIFSSNLVPIAKDVLGCMPQDGSSSLLDFTKCFAGPNSDGAPLCKYESGRRMWEVYRTLSEGPGKANFKKADNSLISKKDEEYGWNPYYDNYVKDAPYPATVKFSEAKLKNRKIEVSDLTKLMRSVFEGTEFDMTKLDSTGNKLSTGAFGTPDRWVTPQKSETNQTVCWERPLGIYRSMVSLVAQSYWPEQVNVSYSFDGDGTDEKERFELGSKLIGTLWFAMDSARTAVYSPIPVGIKKEDLPYELSQNSWDNIDRPNSAFWAGHFVGNVVQMSYNYMIQHVKDLQAKFENDESTNSIRKQFRDKIVSSTEIYATTYKAIVSKTKALVTESTNALWQLSDDLIVKYGYGYCENCDYPVAGDRPDQGNLRHLGYPQKWVDEVYVPLKDGKLVKKVEELKTDDIVFT